MKKLIVFAILSVVCTCCSKQFIKDDAQRTLYITSSEGAFNGDNTETLRPNEAYASINYLSKNSISLFIYYSWGDLNVIIIDIPRIKITGSANNFTILQKGVGAKYTMSLAKIKEQDITVDISGHFANKGNKQGEIVPLSFILTPSDNTICPWLEIKEVSLSPVNLIPGGAISDWPDSQIRFNNNLDVQITLESVGSRKKVKAGESTTMYFSSPYYASLSSIKTALTVEGKKYELYFFAGGQYTEEKHIDYLFVSGRPDTHCYTEYTIDINQDSLPK